MKIRNLFAALCLFTVTAVHAQDCEMPISIQLDENFSNVPQAAQSVLYQTLTRMATESGLTTSSPNTICLIHIY